MRDKNYGFENLWITIWLSNDPLSRSPEEKKQSGVQPRCSFVKSKSELNLSFVSEAVSYGEAFSRLYEPDSINKAISELSSVFIQSTKSIVRMKKISGREFLKDCAEALNFKIETPAEAEEIIRACEDLGEVDSPDVNKAFACEKSKAILLEDFFWSEGADFSPHGSDIGVEIWDSYRLEKPEFNSGTIGFLYIQLVQNQALDDCYQRFLITMAVAIAEIKIYGAIGSDVAKKLEEEISRFRKDCLPKYLPAHKDSVEIDLKKLEKRVLETPRTSE